MNKLNVQPTFPRLNWRMMVEKGLLGKNYHFGWVSVGWSRHSWWCVDVACLLTAGMSGCVMFLGQTQIMHIFLQMVDIYKSSTVHKYSVLSLTWWNLTSPLWTQVEPWNLLPTTSWEKALKAGARCTMLPLPFAVDRWQCAAVAVPVAWFLGWGPWPALHGHVGFVQEINLYNSKPLRCRGCYLTDAIYLTNFPQGFQNLEVEGELRIERVKQTVELLRTYST